jgi:hypothetical protein
MVANPCVPCNMFDGVCVVIAFHTLACNPTATDIAVLRVSQELGPACGPTPVAARAVWLWHLAPQVSACRPCAGPAQDSHQLGTSFCATSWGCLLMFRGPLGRPGCAQGTGTPCSCGSSWRQHVYETLPVTYHLLAYSLLVCFLASTAVRIHIQGAHLPPASGGQMRVRLPLGLPPPGRPRRCGLPPWPSAPPDSAAAATAAASVPLAVPASVPSFPAAAAATGGRLSTTLMPDRR